MLAGKYNIVCDQGSTFFRTIAIKNTDGSVFNLTGYTARMQVRKDVDNTTVILEFTTANSKLVIYPLTGIITMSLTAADTTALTRGGVYDLEIVKTANGEVSKVIRGEFRLEKEVTR